MSNTNPFIFTGLNVPQLPSSDASLRAELARSKQTVAMLQRELSIKVKDVNGVARALVDAKNQVQEAQRETKRAQTAESIAREALTSLNNSRKQQEKKRSMSQDLTVYQETVDELRRQLAEAQKNCGELEVELETCKDDLDGATKRLRDTIEIDIHYDAIDEVRAQCLAEVDTAKNAHKVVQEQQQDLLEIKERLTIAEAELEESKRSAKAFSIDNAQYDKALNEQKDLIAYLSGLNDKLVVDITEKEAKRKALAQERDHFELKFTETLLALKDSEESEAKARNDLEHFKEETADAAHGLSEQKEGLQGEVDEILKQVNDHARDIAMKDALIENLEREKQVLENQVEEAESLNSARENTGRPPTYRNISIVSTRSLADELNARSDDESEYEPSIDAVSDSHAPTEMRVDLELSEVQDIISIAPHDLPAPNLTVSINDAVSTTLCQYQDSRSLDFSPVSIVSTLEPARSVSPALSLYVGEMANIVPSEPAASTLSLSHTTAQFIPPIEPRVTPLALSTINGALDYAPMKPRISTPSPNVDAQTLLLQIDERLDLELMKYVVPITPVLTLSTIVGVLDYAPAEPTTSKGPQQLSEYFDETLNYSPVLIAPRPSALTLSNISGVLEYAPVEHTSPTSSTAVKAVTSSPPILAFSKVKGTMLDCAPVEPESAAPTSTAESQDLSLHVAEAISYSPVEPTLPTMRRDSAAGSDSSSTGRHPRRPVDVTSTAESQRLSLRVAEAVCSSPVEPTLPTMRSNSAARSDSSSTGLRRRRPREPFARLPMRPDNNRLHEITAQWPFKDRVEEDSPPSQVSPPFDPRNEYIVEHIVTHNKGPNRLVHYVLWFLLILLGLYCCYIRMQLYEWEFANGIGFGEGYGNVNDRYNPYGNGHVLLGLLLPTNWISADTQFPVKIVEMIISTASIFDGLMGLSPTLLF
ncbi:hypothetical protein EJ07DRAFT_180982 [Lizonia empirigonia]|nr:hypothetical protein EJ07DRAFT_180982 [Lizonia empirigonia]